MKFRLLIDKEKDEEIVAQVHKPSELTAQIEHLVLQSGNADVLFGYFEDDIHVLNLKDVEVFFVEDGKTFAITTSGTLAKKFLLRYRLYEIEEMLPSNFIRISKSAIANKNAIVKFETKLSGAVDAVFRCGYTDYVSRRCFSDLKKILGV